jgi:hypothetical protein
MHWVEGLLLNDFVRASLDKPAVLEALAEVWVKMARRLRGARLAHGDLQHGNVILVPATRKHAKLAVKLIDYDGMYVPALAGQRSGEVGHPAYQHPQRLREGTYGPEVDRFPLLVVYTALRALMAGGRALWERYDNGDNLLFREEDLRSPRESRVFWELVRLPDPEARRLVDCLSRAAYKPLDQTPLLDDWLGGGTVPAAPAAPGRGSAATLGARVGVAARPSYPVAVPAAPDPARPSYPVAELVAPGPVPPPLPDGKVLVGSPQKRRGVRLLVGCLTGVGAGVCLLLCGLGFWAALQPSQPGKGPAGLARGTGTVGAEGSRSTGEPKSVPPRATPVGPPPTNSTPEPKLTPPPEPRRGSKAEGSRSTGEPKSVPPPAAPVGPPPTNSTPEPKLTPPREPRRGPKPEPLTLQGHTAEVTGVCFSPDGRRLASASGDQTVKVWDAQTGQETRTLKGHTEAVYSVAFSPDGRRLASASGDQTVKVWDVQGVAAMAGPR